MPKKRIYYNEFRRGLDSEPVKPVYLFTGAEAFLKEQGIHAILGKVLEPSDRSLNLECLYAGTDVSGREVGSRALTLPFLAASRVLVVRQAEKWRSADLADLAGYVEKPSLSTVLIISSQEERIKQAYWRALAEKVYHVECYPLFDSQVSGWIERRVSEYGKRISRDAINLLIEQAGQTLSDLENEISKLVNYIGREGLISEANVREAVGHGRQNTMHELNTALGIRDSAQAVKLTGRILAEGVPFLQVLGSLAWYLRRLHNYRSRLEAGESPEQLLVGVRNPVAKREMGRQIKTYRLNEFPAIFRELLRLDEQAKTGRSHLELLMQLAVLRICGQNALRG
ncbi:DNA polymerase III subunit delta [bacterium]|nr:DNA polymerase III subunit delta [bacterium]